MNTCALIGRIVRDPDIRYSQGEKTTCIARYTLAVDRRGKDAGADFITCTAFGKAGEFAEKYLHKGTKIAVTGRIQTNNYTNRDGQKVYTTEVVIDQHEFVESKQQIPAGQPVYEYQAAYKEQQAYGEQQSLGDGFMQIPGDVSDEGLPWN